MDNLQVNGREVIAPNAKATMFRKWTHVYTYDAGYDYHKVYKVELGSLRRYEVAPETFASADWAWVDWRAAAVELGEIMARLQSYADQEHAFDLSCGTLVEVYRGRKIAKGTRGVIKWYGLTRFGESVGLLVEGKEGLQFTSADNVRRVDAAPRARIPIVCCEDSTRQHIF